MTLIKRIEAGETSRELADEVLVALGWAFEAVDTWPHFKRPRRPDGVLIGVNDPRPNPLLSLDDAVGLVPEGMFGSVQFGCERLPATDTNGAELYGLKDRGRYGPLCEGEAPTPAAALTTAILRAKRVE